MVFDPDFNDFTDSSEGFIFGDGNDDADDTFFFGTYFLGPIIIICLGIYTVSYRISL